MPLRQLDCFLLKLSRKVLELPELVHVKLDLPLLEVPLDLVLSEALLMSAFLFEEFEHITHHSFLISLLSTLPWLRESRPEFVIMARMAEFLHFDVPVEGSKENSGDLLE